MHREFPKYILTDKGILIRTLFPKFIAVIPAPYYEIEINILEWWDEAHNIKKEQTIQHAKKWMMFRKDNFEKRLNEYRQAYPD